MKDVFSHKSVGEFTRVGRLTTRAGVIQTPVFMPVGTRGAVKGLDPARVKEGGAQIILGNTYHLHLQPGEGVVKSLGGLHQFTNWDGPILTDSGGFQVFSLAHNRQITEEGVTFKDHRTGDKIMLTPEKSMQIQIDLGSDVIMAFDDVVSLDQAGRARTLEALERTHRWLDRCIAEFKRLTADTKEDERPLFFGIAQGGLDKDLRRRSLEYVQSSDLDGVAIGGLSVGESREEMHDMLEFLAPIYDPAKVHYLMGVGDPVDFRFAIEHGIDMVDCVLATRNARHGTAWVRGDGASGLLDQRVHLTNKQFEVDQRPIDPSCDCATCRIPHPTCIDGSKERFQASENSSTGSFVSMDTTSKLSKSSESRSRSLSGHCSMCGEAFSGFSRGFLRHQFKIKETLAGSLVSIHNLRYLHRIAEGYRSLS